MDDEAPGAAHTFVADADICQQLLTRYARSSAVQHRHLCATAAATRSIIQSSSLPLTPLSYFAATITSLSDSKALDSNALGALTSFLSIVLPLVGRGEIKPEKAGEAVGVLVATVEKGGDKLGTSGARAVVKCVGVLVAEFCDLEEWDSVSPGFEWLVKFSIDKRPKVRKCALDCLLTVFKSFESSAISKRSCKSIYKLLKKHIPLTNDMHTSEGVGRGNSKATSKPEHQEFLHLLNLIKHIAPYFSPKLSKKMLSQLLKILSPKFSVVTRHLLDVVSAILATSGAKVTSSNAEEILRPLVSYISMAEKNPVDSVLFAANLVKTALQKLHDGGINEWATYIPLLSESLAGFLSPEDDAAIQTSIILRELIDRHIDGKSFLTTESEEKGDRISDDSEHKAIQTICAAFFNVLNSSPQIPSEHFFSVVACLFLKLGMMSDVFMKHILLKLGDLVNAAPAGSGEIRHVANLVSSLKECIGSAVAAMGPEKILALIPITVTSKDFSCSNIWLIPILKKNIFGSSLRFFMKHIVPLAKSFEKGSRKVKKSVIREDLQAYAHSCWGLLPAFCRQPSDTHQSFGDLVKLLIPFLKKDSFKLASIAISLQELVNGNKSALASAEGCVQLTKVQRAGDLDESATGPWITHVYSRKIAKKNIKALAACAKDLLRALIEALFETETPPETRDLLKGAIGCLLSVCDASLAKDLFIASLEKLQLQDNFGGLGKIESDTDGSIKENENGEIDAKKWYLILDLASCMTEGSDEDLTNLLFSLIKHTLQASEEVGQMKAYQTLSRILEKHSWFCASQFDAVMDVLTGMKSSDNFALVESRFACLQTLLIHGLMRDLDEENTKAFLILNEIIVKLKDSKEEGRKVAYDALRGLSSKLRSSSDASSKGPYHKLLTMITGYLSGSSPQIKSGVVSALSVLVYNDPDICITMPEVVPSVMGLLHSKAVELIKAALGFVKVLVSCVEANNLQPLLSDIVDGIIRWSSVSRHHFKSKVSVILEILMRKCGPAKVKALVPEKYSDFVQGVYVNRHGKVASSKDAGHKDSKPELSDSSSKRQQKRKRGESAGEGRPWKRNRDENEKGGKSIARGEPSNKGNRQKGKLDNFRGKKHKDRTPVNKNGEKSVPRPAGGSKFAKKRNVGRKDRKPAARRIKLSCLRPREPNASGFILSPMAAVNHLSPYFTGHREPQRAPAKTLTRFKVYCSKPTNPDPFAENKKAQVDYDAGTHKLSTKISGIRKSDLPKRQRLRVDGDRFQKDWSISEVVDRITELDHWEDVDGVLNRWAGRFARKNFPVLIREITNRGFIEHSTRVFNWMKNQKNYCARNDIYNMMIRLYARHNRIDQARGLFFEMQKWRCKPDVETYNALIHAHGRAGQWRWGVNIMEDMLRAAVPPSRTTYNNLINACGSSGNWKEALRVVKKMTDNGIGPDLVTHNIILSAYKTGSQYSKAIAYFDLMKSTNNVHPDTTTLNIVIHCLVKLGKFEEAIQIFNSMREKSSESSRPDIVTYTSIMHMYSICGQAENCRAVFSTMLAEGLKPNIVSYNTLLGSYASLGQSEQAMSIFIEMKERGGVHPDVVTYTSLLNAFGRSQQPEKAREIFDMMRKNNCKPNLVTYNALIDAYGSNGFLAQAVELLREMDEVGIEPNVVSISTLLAACGRCCEKVKIDSVLKAANLRGIRLNTIAYNSAIGSYMNVGEYCKAVDIYRKMREKMIKPDSVTFNVLISGCCKMSRFSEALDFLAEMRDMKIPLSTEGQLAEAESLFSTMKMDGLHPDVIAYTAMLHAYSSAEQWEKAFGVFQEMELNSVQPDSVACSALMRAFNRGSQPGKVILIAEFMREKKLPFDDAVFFEIVSACSILRDWKTLTEVIQTMETSLPRISVGTLNHLIHCFGKVGKIDTMMKLFLKVVASGAQIDSSTYTVLLKNLLAAGNWRKYIEVMQWMDDAGIPPSVHVYNSLLSYAQTSCGPENAAVIRKRTESLRMKFGETISSAEERDQTLATNALMSSTS
ncbi:pentatricopeptide repeat-containing family protein [Striga asiatica]|uniref:Pentatricopeptide repeat-containing family protein n=1 Tax=Striga asiatica TaxID=4170 RepID=A0A5A7NZE5_STRAF|nr:pentatricopeptide repeat-containing family protein [Striga asiatica]